MREPLSQRLMHAWNVFRSGETRDNYQPPVHIGGGTSSKSGKTYRPVTSEKNTVTAIYSRISIDVGEVDIQHAKVNENGAFEKSVKSSLNHCLTLEANIDQSSEEFMRDVVITMFDEGHAVIVPVDTTIDPKVSTSYDIQSMRVGVVREWYPKHVKVHLYNDTTGQREDVVLRKQDVAIIENPLYLVMNETNSTLRRLIHKINLLDKLDNQIGSSRLDLIIQLPYVIKSEARRQQAEQRKKDIETQLTSSKFGVAYTDGSEKITQLNRAVENNLPEQVQELTRMLYGQLGITSGILDGTATEEEKASYYNNTVKPIVKAIAKGIERRFLTKTARTQGHKIYYHQDMFKLIPISVFSEVAEKFLRNEVLSPNEVRGIVGFKPSKDPASDELRNRNIAESGDNESKPLDKEDTDEI